MNTEMKQSTEYLVSMLSWHFFENFTESNPVSYFVMKEITILQSLADEVELATVNLGELSTRRYYDRVNVQIYIA